MYNTITIFKYYFANFFISSTFMNTSGFEFIPVIWKIIFLHVLNFFCDVISFPWLHIGLILPLMMNCFWFHASISGWRLLLRKKRERLIPGSCDVWIYGETVGEGAKLQPNGLWG